MMEMQISLPTDKDGYTGRECPSCESYFKIRFGTGLEGDVPCHCPYCGQIDNHDKFWTRDQNKYVESVALNQVTTSLLRQMKKLERRPDRRVFLSIGITVKGRPISIRHYAEAQLEQEVRCESCTLEYAIFGAFGFCPDCGIHNSLQILNSNINLIQKLLCLAADAVPDVARQLVENALEDLVSVFDGFGRELFKAHASATTDPPRARAIVFQNLAAARQAVLALLEVDLQSIVGQGAWKVLERAFAKRHLIAHKMGVVDEKYLKETGAGHGMLGRRITVTADEVLEGATIVRRMAEQLHSSLSPKQQGS